MMISQPNRVMMAACIAGALGVTAPAIGQVIYENLKLLAVDGAAGDYFGGAISVDAGLVAVGAIYDDDFGLGSGSAYVFDAVTGVQVAKLLPADGYAGDWFGRSVSIADGLVAVGAHQNNDMGEESGSAYVFDAATGVQIVKLLPTDGSAFSWFGYSVAIDNGIVVVGAYHDDAVGESSGAAYLFDANTGVQLAKLIPNDATGNDYFGRSVAINNGIVAVGAIWDQDNGYFSGSAYTFDAATGVQLAKLLPTDGMSGDEFGISVGVDNGIVVVGARYNGGSGSAYLFDAMTGAQMFELLSNDRASGDLLGRSIAISNGIVAVGAMGDTVSGYLSGSAYLFDVATGSQIAKLSPSDGAMYDSFGWSIGLNNGIVVVGAHRDDDKGSDSGSGYVFTAPVVACAADLNNDGLLNFFDVSAFLNAFGTGDPAADFTGDGFFNFFDVSAFLNAFGAGCP